MKSINRIVSWARIDKEVLLYPETGLCSISISENNLIRFRYTKNNSFNAEDNYVLNNDVRLIDFTVSEIDNQLQILTGKHRIMIGLDSFSMSIYDQSGNIIIASADDFLSVDDKTTSLRLSLRSDEKIYGLGQDPMANLNQRDKERRIWHQYGHISRSGNIGIPFFISDRNYGVFLNTSYPSVFDIGKAEAPEYDRLGILMAEFPDNWSLEPIETNPDNIAITLNEDDLDLWFMIENDMDSLLYDFYTLTGRPAILPKWAFGFIQCNCRYRSQDEMLKIAGMMREKNVPCDVLLIDWLWFKEFGDLKWDGAYWPNPKEMLTRLKELGFKVMMAQHPFISENCINLEHFREKGYLNINPGDSRLTYDHSNPEAREFWWNKIKAFYEEGISGYWTDMGELEEHHPGTKSFLGDRDKIHNIYMTLWTKGLYEGQRRDFGTRYFALNRASYPGIQKYGTVLWSGDIDARWEVMKEQVVIGQGVAMSGIPYWSTDVGGFLTVEGYTPELFVRWLQWNVFCPIFRVHGTRPGNEIWSFGEQTEEICRYFIRLRYRLLPYIYSLARKTREKGSPIMRAMAMDFGNDEKAAESIYQYMFGESILVSPVLDKGERHKETYLPEGVWYDFYTDNKYNGRQSISACAPLEKLPLFVKGGSIIPMTDAKNQLSVSEGMEKNIQLHIYPGSSASFVLYDDDGVSFEYENTGFISTKIEYVENGIERSVKIFKSEGGIRINRVYDLIFHDADEPELPLNYDYIYDKEDRLLFIKGIAVDSNEQIEIMFKARHSSCTSNPELKPDEELSVKPAIKPETARPSAADFRFYAHTDIENEGRLTVSLTWENDCSEFDDCVIKAEFVTEPYWTIEKEDNSFHNAKMYSKQILHYSEIKEKRAGNTGSIVWTALPITGFMPVKCEGSISIKVCRGEDVLYDTVKNLTWGSGFITRWSTVSCFRNDNNEGMDTVFEPELDPEKPFYVYEGSSLPWIRDNLYEYNCFGYVELRRYGSYLGPGSEGINGIAYLKNTAWCEEDTYALLNISSELMLKVWLNGELVHSSDDIEIDKTEPKPLHFKKGFNRLLVKAGVFTEKPYSGREFGFNMKLLDVTDTSKINRSILFSN